jgi:hypothetical protein
MRDDCGGAEAPAARNPCTVGRCCDYEAFETEACEEFRLRLRFCLRVGKWRRPLFGSSDRAGVQPRVGKTAVEPTVLVDEGIPL